MEFKLVYRALRKISDWTLAFYSEVHVAGQENVPAGGPLILVSCHHNEIIDIATLAATIPHRRPICFWAKSTMFKNPISRAILSSSGSIPVRRNPNSTSAAPSPGEDKPQLSDVRLSLFRETFQALDKDEVIGLFPEGTSYTEPQIVQVKDGAAWAALEYARWQLQHEHDQDGKSDIARKRLTIVPVGIVYTDKSRYQSRVCVTYGQPIDLEPYTRRYLSAAQDSRANIKTLTDMIEKALLQLTINAPDWDTWFAARIVRDIVWKGASNIPLGSYVDISQSFINCLLTETSPDVVSSLVRYYALLHHMDITHDTFAAIFPMSSNPTLHQTLVVFSRELFTTLFHPRFLFFLPCLPLYIPVYIIGSLSERLLGIPGEEESKAQRKAVCSGLVFGIISSFCGAKLAKLSMGQPVWLLGYIRKAGLGFLAIREGVEPIRGIRKVLTLTFMMYLTTRVLFRWHNALIGGNQRQYRRLAASWKILLGVLSPASSDEKAAEISSITRPPIPASNPFVKRKEDTGGDLPRVAAIHAGTQARMETRRIPSRTLARQLFSARTEAEYIVEKFRLTV